LQSATGKAQLAKLGMLSMDDLDEENCRMIGPFAHYGYFIYTACYCHSHIHIIRVTYCVGILYVVYIIR
jgi:hypothetical protein